MLSSLGLCCRLMPGSERVPTIRPRLWPENCSTGEADLGVEFLTINGIVVSLPFCAAPTGNSSVGISLKAVDGTSPAGDAWDTAGSGEEIGGLFKRTFNPESVREMGERQLGQKLSVWLTGVPQLGQRRLGTG